MKAGLTTSLGFALLGGIGIGLALSRARPPFRPPPDSAMPGGRLGAEIRLGEAIFNDPRHQAAAYVGNDLRCADCHLRAGRQAGSAPLWAAYVAYPAYRRKDHKVESFAQRLQGCFEFSMNGKPPPLGGKTLVALESYANFLARGLPVGPHAQGRLYRPISQPTTRPSYASGARLYAARCAACHGGNGAGLMANGTPVFPALWGKDSFNWGAGMADINHAAAFIHAFMPQNAPGSLSPQQAWDIATYIDSQTRPQDPRFTGNLAATRHLFHDTPFSTYGLSINNHVMGDPAETPPAGP